MCDVILVDLMIRGCNPIAYIISLNDLLQLFNKSGLKSTRRKITVRLIMLQMYKSNRSIETLIYDCDTR